VQNKIEYFHPPVEEAAFRNKRTKRSTSDRKEQYKGFINEKRKGK
jgi:hypothetical protein